MYETGIDLLGMLLMRATGRARWPTWSPSGSPVRWAWRRRASWRRTPDRLATAYLPGPDGLAVLDPPDGTFAVPPPFEELGSGLVSTAPDVLRFFCAMADGGAPVLTADEVALMTADALTPRSGGPRGCSSAPASPGAWPPAWTSRRSSRGRRRAAGGGRAGPGRTAYVDPVRDTVAVLLTQRAMTGPLDGLEDFWMAVAAAASG